ncbi:MAG: hypothetical protein JWQ67_180 [Marmoricola sp.]|nr:hypothetical protein [Marmoricola sp.]
MTLPLPKTSSAEVGVGVQEVPDLGCGRCSTCSRRAGDRGHMMIGSSTGSGKFVNAAAAMPGSARRRRSWSTASTRSAWVEVTREAALRASNSAAPTCSPRRDSSVRTCASSSDSSRCDSRDSRSSAFAASASWPMLARTASNSDASRCQTAHSPAARASASSRSVVRSPARPTASLWAITNLPKSVSRSLRRRHAEPASAVAGRTWASSSTVCGRPNSEQIAPCSVIACDHTLRFSAASDAAACAADRSFAASLVASAARTRAVVTACVRGTARVTSRR